MPDVVNVQATLVASGGFVNKGGQTTRGAYRIERASGDLRLVLTDDFMTDDAPDLRVLLSPLTVATAENGNANTASLIVAPLMARRGVQVYDLPDDLDLARFQSVLVHCVTYRHLFGAAPVTRAAGS